MKRFRAFMLMIIAAAAGLMLGVILRQRYRQAASEVHETPPASVSALTNPAPSVKSSIGSRVSGDSPLTAKLKQDLSMSSGVTRWLCWLEALEKASAEDFPRLIAIARGNPATFRLATTRWIELYPRQCFDHLVAESKNGRTYVSQELGIQLFREWPKRDPEAAIAALNEALNFGGRDNWRVQVAETILQNDTERGLRLLSEWHIETFEPRADPITKWAAVDPLHAAQFCEANPAGYTSQYVMKLVGKEWAKTDPAGALHYTLGNNGEFNAVLANTTLAEWASRNPAEAADWLTGTDAATRNRLSSKLVESWAKTDVSGALAWSESNLNGSSFDRAVSSIMAGLAERDLPGAADLVAQMTPSRTKQEAAIAIAQRWFPFDSMAATEPPEAVAWLKNLDLDSIKGVVDLVAWRWSETDPRGMAAFLTSSDKNLAPIYAYDILARALARKDPSEALDWSSRLPEGQHLSAGAEAFGEWRRSQPDAAMQWLHDLPSNDPRRQSFFERTLRNFAYDPQAAQSLAVMSDPDRTAARKIIPALEIPEDRRARLMELLDGR